jgi:SAM-dependent methyltransferase
VSAEQTDAMPTCLFCASELRDTVVDLGMSPLCETFLEASQLDDMEPFYPLNAYVCPGCWLVQVQEYVTPDGIFAHYPYFSSYSDSWLAHAERYADAMVERFALDASSHVVELGSNDGYLLQYFVQHGIPVLGVEPAANVAEVAIDRGVPTEVAFFGRETAARLADHGVRADLVCGANVLAQVPDVNDFVAGIATLLANDGVCTIEFPHLVRTIEGNQFDQFYHEHFSYFSLVSVERIFAHHGMALFDVEELATHGGSLRIYACHDGAAHLDAPTTAVDALRQHEHDLGVETIDFYATFADRVRRTKRDLLRFLIDARDKGAHVVGYGAPGKGNTLLNYCGIRTDLLDYTVDRNPLKQGRYLPGTHIPIHHPDRIAQTRPDYVLILPWNLRGEIAGQLAHVREWGGQLVVPIPRVEILDGDEVPTGGSR